jgi:hypothetical protein
MLVLVSISKTSKDWWFYMWLFEFLLKFENCGYIILENMGLLHRNLDYINIGRHGCKHKFFLNGYKIE